jgi:hypothetical protein
LSISFSTTEEDYIATTSYCTQIIWMKKALQYIKVEYNQPISMLCDNTSVISISKNPVMHSKKNNIPIKYHFLREQVNDKTIKLEYLPTKEKIAYIFTKPLPKDEFKYLRQRLGVQQIHQ